MTYSRFVKRNNLGGNYAVSQSDDLALRARDIAAGDLRRLEENQRDKWHLDEYAKRTGLRSNDVAAVLALFFAGKF